MLNGKVAVVTGSSRGIGRAIAIRMAQEGARVVVNGLDHERVVSVVNEIREQGGCAVDVCESVHTMLGGERIISTAIESFGGLDILINNAGIIRDTPAERMSEDDFDEVIRTHIKGTFACTKPAIPYMRMKKQGCIINMTSLAGLSGMIGQLNYSAAKAGIIGMTWTMALELARDNICVNAIAPAALTDMTQPYVEKARQKAERLGQEMPDYWKIGTPMDVAELAVALSLSESRQITGNVFSVNGGHIGIWHKPQHETIVNRSESSLTAQEIVAEILSILKK